MTKIYKSPILLRFISIFFSIAFLIGLIGCKDLFQGNENGITNYEFGGDFILESADVKQWKFSQNLKEVNLVFFGYTSCPDYCPTTLSKFKKLNGILGEDRDRVQYIFISVDSEKDKVDQLKAYVDFYVPNGIGLAGSKEIVDEVVSNYKSSYTRNGDFIDHSTYVYLIDGNLKTRYMFRHADSAQSMAKIIQLFFNSNKD